MWQQEHRETLVTAGGFFATRWRGLVPMRTLFWRDMAAVGTAINVATTIASLVAFANGAPFWLGLGLFLAPAPYNVFLTLAVWRTADRQGGGWAGMARIGSALWLIAALTL